MPTDSCDVLIIGGGVIGISTGIAILESKPSLRVLIVEKENGIGCHASGRNSGVLHAGFYYSPDSLKARFCRDGNRELKELAKENEIPLLNCGKIVVTSRLDEEVALDNLFERGIQNGVDLEILPKSQLPQFEPLARTFERFLWSPNTSVSDSMGLTNALLKRFLNSGGRIVFRHKVKIEKGSEVYVKNIRFRHVVNCAGSYSDNLARTVGIANDYAMVPFMGVYRATELRHLPLRRLVYPVPHKINPFLGVHFTITVDGKVKIGPSAIPVLGREQYDFRKNWSVADISQAVKGAISLISHDSHDFSEIIKSEFPKFYLKRLVSDSARLVPDVKKVTDWSRKPPGIRAQLVHLPTGKLEQDFVVRSFMNSTHVLNAVSPGWTSSIPFGRYVASEFVLPRM